MADAAPLSDEMRSVLDTAVDAIILIDEYGHIRSCNRATDRLFGYEPGGLEGQNVSVLMPSPDRDRHDDYIARYRREGNARIIGIGREVQAMRRNGEVFPAELSVGEHRAADGTRTFIGIVRDISRRKQLEKEALHAQKMEAVGRLASGVAHDFNNLLMGIIGCVDAMVKHLQPDNPARHYADELRLSADRGKRITRQLLEFTRKSGGQRTGLRPADVVSRMGSMLARLVGAEVDLQIDARSEGVVQADRGQLEQVLVNLVVNAADALAVVERDDATIRVRVVDLLDPASDTRWAERIEGPHVELVVEDNGCGMDPDKRHRIFEPFYTTKEPARGTGLGLSMVFTAVEGMGGQIDVETAPGEGAVFRLVIPMDPGVPDDVDDQPPPPDPQKLRGTVLLLEDVLLVRISIAEYLMDAGLRVLAAADAEEAGRLVEGIGLDRIDVVLSDVVLPGQSGPRFVARLREQRPDLPVVFMSARPGEQLREEGRVPQDASVLHKPFERDELIAAMRAQLRPAGP